MLEAIEGDSGVWVQLFPRAEVFPDLNGQAGVPMCPGLLGYQNGSTDLWKSPRNTPELCVPDDHGCAGLHSFEQRLVLYDFFQITGSIYLSRYI